MDKPDDTGRISFHSIRRGLNKIGEIKDQWAGIPMPLNGHRLSIAKGYPYEEAWKEINKLTEEPEKREEGWKLVNTFWSWRWRNHIQIWIDPEGKRRWGPCEQGNNTAMIVDTARVSPAWSLETELRAMSTLRSLITHHQFRCYFLTGTFVESSRKSGVRYLFRRLRPTIAMSEQKGEMHILCTLCQHPVAYYEQTWAGAMCPTDDVLSHLLLMRGAEAMFWKRSNQHPAWDRNRSGI